MCSEDKIEGNEPTGGATATTSHVLSNQRLVHKETNYGHQQSKH